MLGIAQKAGKLSSGEFVCETEIKSGKSSLIILAEDASENTKDKFNSMCSFYKVKIIHFGTKELLGHCIGKELRAVLSFKDYNFAKAILKLYEA